MLDYQVGDKVRVRRGWNPLAPTRTVTKVDEATGEAELDSTPSNGVKITYANAIIWEKVRDAK